VAAPTRERARSVPRRARAGHAARCAARHDRRPVGHRRNSRRIALGVAWLGWSTDVVAVRVAPRIVANGWRAVAARTQNGGADPSRGIEFSVPRSALRVRVVDAMGKGYGHPTAEGERAALSPRNIVCVLIRHTARRRLACCCGENRKSRGSFFGTRSRRSDSRLPVRPSAVAHQVAGLTRGNASRPICGALGRPARRSRWANSQ